METSAEGKQDLAEQKRKFEEEQKEFEAARKAIEERKREEAEKAKQKAEEERRQKEAEEAERKAEKERKRKEAEAKLKAEDERKSKEAEEERLKAEEKLIRKQVEEALHSRIAKAKRKKQEEVSKKKVTQAKKKYDYFKKLTAPAISNYKRNDRYIISWAAVRGAKEYSLECSPVETFSYGTEYCRGTKTEYTISHQFDDIKFCRVRAIGEPGVFKHSDWSNTLEFQKEYRNYEKKLVLDNYPINQKSEWICRCGTRNPIELSNCKNCHVYKSHVIPKSW